MKHETPRNVKVVRVIEVRSLRGGGSEEDPVREVVQYWSFDGVMLAEKDKLKPDTFAISVNWDNLQPPTFTKEHL